MLNDRFGANFTEEDRLFFEQLKEKATNTGGAAAPNCHLFPFANRYGSARTR